MIKVVWLSRVVVKWQYSEWWARANYDFIGEVPVSFLFLTVRLMTLNRAYSRSFLLCWSTDQCCNKEHSSAKNLHAKLIRISKSDELNIKSFKSITRQIQNFVGAINNIIVYYVFFKSSCIMRILLQLFFFK